MKDNFAAALAAVLKHEGGFVINPHDPGGATCQGVTQAVYDDWRTDRGETKHSVRDIAQCEVEAIYRKLYWSPIRGDDLPIGVDYCVFDFAINSGPNRAIRFLQRMSGALEDGQIGPQTLGRVQAQPPKPLINAICDSRLTFLQSLNTWKFFGRGWARRVSEVRELAVAMAA